jgi:hypothetical protein
MRAAPVALRPGVLALAVLLGVAGCTAQPAGTSAPSSATGSATSTASSAASSPTEVSSADGSPAASSPAPPVPTPSTAELPATPQLAASDANRPTAAAPQAQEGFAGTVSTIDPALAARMAPSWRPGCPVPLTDLRYLTLTYRGFDGADHQGELVVAASVADDVVAIFRQLYAAGYPISSMRLVDDFGGDDNASMSANNTSAFNCRPVTGGGGFSEHSYGTAIDVDPVQNPYVSGSTVLPAAGRRYVDRPDSPGVIHADDEVVRTFADHGFKWGGAWSGPIDYQHFSVSGR